MLYRDKAVAVIGLCAEAPEEADFLRNIGCKVAYFDKKQPYSIQGSDKVEALVTPDETMAVDAVFILRSGIAAADLLPGLEMENGHIRVDAAMATSLPGVFACGDCTGAPYQITKATGEGTVAALSAAAWCAGKTK